jgi:hypothetical protein
MLAVGLALDVGAYHRLLPYQPGWVALPLGAVELAATMALARGLGVPAPLDAAVVLFAASWLWAQVLGHAALPLAHMQYAEDGGELGRAGVPLAAAVTVALAAAGGIAWTTRPPTVHLHGVVRGPLRIDRPETLVGGTVYGGIVVTSDHVTIRDVAVVGGENGIDVEEAHGVMLDRVRVTGAREDGIHARRSAVMIEGCVVDASPGTQGIDVSFAMEDGMSEIAGCVVDGGDVGITTHTVMADVHDNVVLHTRRHAIELTEMSMGHVRGNVVRGARGAGIYCGDHSQCRIERNRLLGVAGPGIVAMYYADATLTHNTFADSGPVASYDNSTVR